MAQVGSENRPLTSIRGFAALYVVGFHLNDWVDHGVGILPHGVFAYGHGAVDIFFVLSGFILATVYGGMDLDQSGNFYLKRILRLYPLHMAIMVFLAVAVIAAPLLHAPLGSDEIHLWHAFPYVLLLIHSFTPHEIGWNNPAWSVSVELLCYALFPAIVVVLRRLPASVLIVLTAVAAIAQVWLLATAYDISVGIPAILRGLVGFNFGVLLRLVLRLERPPSPRAASLIEIAAVIALVAAPAFGAYNAIPLAAAALIAILLYDRGIVSRFLRRTVPFWLGSVSFSIYLLHHPIIQVMTKIIPLRRVPLPMPLAGWVYAAGMVALILAVSHYTYIWIEQPGRHLVRTSHALLFRWRSRKMAIKPG